MHLIDMILLFHYLQNRDSTLFVGSSVCYIYVVVQFGFLVQFGFSFV